MKIKKIAILFVLFVFSNHIFAQNTTGRPLDDKFSNINSQIEKILSGEINQNINQDNKSGVTDGINKFTDDEIDDIELFAAINPTDSNNIVISWMKLDPTNSNNALNFMLYYTNDFGQTWEQGDIDFSPRDVVPPNEVLSGGGDPMIVFDTDGNAYISWIYTIIRVISIDEMYVDIYLTYAKSTDNGATWTRETGDDQYISFGTMEYSLDGGFQNATEGNFPDKQWMSVNPLNNDVYVSLAEFNTTDNYHTGIDTWGIRRKPADSPTFQEKVLVPPIGTLWAQLGSMVVDKNGNVHAVYPYYESFPDPPVEKLVHAVSTDDGQTFSTPNYIADVDVRYFSGVGQANNTSTTMYDRLYPSSYIAVDTCSASPYEGRLYVVWNSGDDNYTKKVDVWLSYSDDNGTTWSEPQIVHSDPPRNYGFHHRPTIYVNPDGVLVLAWYDNRGYEIPDVYMNNYYYALSFDGGETFGEYKVSPFAFNYNDEGFSHNIGEYFQILASQNNVIAFYTAFDGDDADLYYNILPFGEETAISESRPITSKMNIEKVYPNPVSDVLNINFNLEQSTKFPYQIFSQDGKLIKTGEEINGVKGANKAQVSVQELQTGVYFISFDTEWGTFVKKFIKK